MANTQKKGSFLTKEIGNKGKTDNSEKVLKIKKSKNNKEIEIPTKTTVNLIVAEKKNFDVKKSILILVVVVAVVFVVGKIGIWDRYQKAIALEGQAAALQSEEDAYNAYLEDYDSVNEEYSHYAKDYLTDEEKALIDSMDAMEILENYVLNQAKVSEVSLSGNTMNITVSDVSLNQLSEMVNTLQTDEQVVYVNVYQADTGDDEAQTDTNDGSQKVTATMSITLEGGSQE